MSLIKSIAKALIPMAFLQNMLNSMFLFFFVIVFFSCQSSAWKQKQSGEKNYIDSCVAQYSLNNYSETIRYANEGLKRNSDVVEYYFLRGSSQTELLNYEDAIRDFSFIIQHKGSLVVAHSLRFTIDSFVYFSYKNRADIYVAGGEFENAIFDFKNRLNYMPGDLVTTMNIATCYYKIGLDDSAAHYYNKAYKIDSNNYRLLVNIGEYYLATNRFIAAKKCFDRALNNSQDYEAYLGRAIANVYTKDFKSAESDFVNVFKLNDRDSTAYFYYANYKWILGDTIGYCEVVNKAHKLSLLSKQKYEHVCEEK